MSETIEERYEKEIEFLKEGLLLHQELLYCGLDSPQDFDRKRIVAEELLAWECEAYHRGVLKNKNG